MSKPPTVTVPAVGGMKPVIMRMVVDLPAPFGPEKTQHFAALDRERNAIDGPFWAERFD